MTEEPKLEIVRRVLAPFPAPPTPEQMEAQIGELWDPDCDYYPVRRWTEAAPCHGRDEVTRFFLQIWDAWQTLDYRLADVQALEGDRSLARGHMSGVGRGSGIEVEGDVYHVIWLRLGRVFRMEDHLTERGALGALGLEAE